MTIVKKASRVDLDLGEALHHDCRTPDRVHDGNPLNPKFRYSGFGFRDKALAASHLGSFDFDATFVLIQHPPGGLDPTRKGLEHNDCLNK